MEPRNRFGTFFLLVGLVLMLLFVLSVMSKAMNTTFLFLAFACLSLSFVFRPRKERQDSGRFGAVKRLNQKNRERKESKHKPGKKEEKK
jgi:hypothetical protein